MSRARHSKPRPRRWRGVLSALAVPASGFTLVAAAAVAVTLSGPASDAVTASTLTVAGNPGESTVSRDAVREDTQAAQDLRIERPAAQKADSWFAVEDATVRSAPSPEARATGSVEVGDEIVVTGEVVKGFAQVLYDDTEAWIAEATLAEELPPELRPLGTEVCPRAPGVENGLQPDAVRTLRAVCERFPEITSYGGLAPRNDHAKGQAVDVMVTGSPGDEIAQFLIDHAAELGVNYIIWEQRIYTISRPGWKAMADRGGATANHYDHVHVSTHVDSGTG